MPSVSVMQNQQSVFIYTALPCEAGALISRLQLKKKLHIRPFAIYTNTDVCLTVTGPGKSAMAAGVAYSQAKFSKIAHPILLNVGIAGHLDAPLGQLFIADKITDADSGRNYYPPRLFDLACTSAAVLTVAKPEDKYQQKNVLYDMEASAFYETAVKFSTAELIQSIKVISDNQASPAQNIKSKQVAELIATHVDTFVEIQEQLQGLAKEIEGREPEFYQIYSEQWHFTVSQKHRLKELLCRWQVLSNGKDPNINFQLVNAKAVLSEIEQKISCINFFL